MRPLWRFLRRLLGRGEEETVRAAPVETGALPGGGMPEGAPAAAPDLLGKTPPGAGKTQAPAGGGMPPSAWGEAAVFSGGMVPGTTEGEFPSPVRTTAETGSPVFGRQEEILPLSGPPEDGARGLSELLRFHRRMGSTVGTFGEEVL